MVGAAAVLEEAAERLLFGAICMVKKLRRFKKAQSFGGRSRQMMTIEKTTGLFIGPLMAEIRGVYLELNLSKTCVQRGTRVKMMSASGNI